MVEGIWQCNGCGRLHAEYHNGCVVDHPPPRKVVLVIDDIRSDSSDQPFDQPSPFSMGETFEP